MKAANEDKPVQPYVCHKTERADSDSKGKAKKARIETENGARAAADGGDDGPAEGPCKQVTSDPSYASGTSCNHTAGSGVTANAVSDKSTKLRERRAAAERRRARGAPGERRRWVVVRRPPTPALDRSG